MAVAAVTYLPAGAVASVDDPYPQVLRFNGNNHARVGKIGPMDSDLGFNWGVEVVFRGSGGYFGPTWGWGGAHPHLHGPNGGNIRVYASGTAEYGNVQHNHEYTPDANEWVHYLQVCDSTNLYVVNHIFGIPDGGVRIATAKKDDGVTTLSGVDQRRVANASQNAEVFMGASASHAGFTGDIARMRLIDTDAPHDTSRLGVYQPTERTDPSPFWYAGGNKLWDVFYDFTDGLLIDKSIAGVNRTTANGGGKHNLTRSYTRFGLEANQAPGTGAEAFGGEGAPEFVRSASCPLVPGARPASSEPSRTPTDPPANVVIYDSFGRAAQTPWHTDTPTLGTTEVGGKTWYAAKIVNADPNHPFLFGIMEGIARPLTRTRGAIAVVNAETTDYRIVVRARRGTKAPTHTGICFRQVGIPTSADANSQNCFIAWTEDVSAWSANAQLRVRPLVNGAESTCDGGAGVPAYALGSTWDAIEVVCSGSTFTFYKHEGATRTLVGTLNSQTTHSTGTYVGIATLGNDITNQGFCTYNAFERYAA